MSMQDPGKKGQFVPQIEQKRTFGTWVVCVWCLGMEDMAALAKYLVIFWAIRRELGLIREPTEGWHVRMDSE
jgi:hypothetical protein